MNNLGNLKTSSSLPMQLVTSLFPIIVTKELKGIPCFLTVYPFVCEYHLSTWLFFGDNSSESYASTFRTDLLI